MEINIINFILATAVTIIAGAWCLKIKDEVKKVFIIVTFIFFYFYCGVTSFYINSNQYLIYYIIYTLTLGFSFYIFRNISIKVPGLSNDKLSKFTKNYYWVFIFLFIIYNLSDLIYPVNKIGLLFNPPTPNVSLGLDKQIQGHTISESFGYLLIIFFYYSLSQLVKKPIKLFLVLFVVEYIGYVSNAYISRGGMLRIFALVILILYFNYPNKRKLILTVSLVSSFFLIFFFAIYISMRMGVESNLDNMSGAFKSIANVEFSFSLYFDDLIRMNRGEFGRYLWWLFTLPLPGFLKFGSADYLLNIEYTENILHVSRFAPNFFVILPGLVIEGVYSFGKYLFPLHALLFGFTLNIFFNTLNKYKAFSVLCLYYIIDIPLRGVRAGSISLYPTVYKLIPIFLVILIFLIRIKINKFKQKST